MDKEQYDDSSQRERWENNCLTWEDEVDMLLRDEYGEDDAGRDDCRHSSPSRFEKPQDNSGLPF